MNVIINIILPCLSLVLLLFCGAFFASSETAFTSLSKIKIRQMLKNKEKGASKIAELKGNMDVLITTVLTGTNFVNTLASSIATAFAVNVFGAQYVSVATAVMTILIIIFAEVIPKTLAAVKPVEIARFSAGALIVIKKILFPVVWLFNKLTQFIKFIEKRIYKDDTPLVTEEELKTLIDLGKNEGTLEQNEKEMLDRIFEFSDLHVFDILKHRSLVVSLDADSSYEEVIAVFKRSGYSRLPVYDKDEESIIGLLHYKSILFASAPILNSKDFVRICMRPVLFVPQTLTALELLQKFKKERANFAVALDEYGLYSGIVTMSDLLQAVFGHMTDEFSIREVAPEKRIKIAGTKEFIVPGDMKIEDLNDVLKLNLDSDNYETLGGWLLEKIGELPSVGAVYKNDGTVYIIEDQSARRIQSVRIILLSAR